MTSFGRAGTTSGDLARLWRDAAAFMPHFAGCTCTGPHMTLDRDTIEADLLAYLAQIYHDAGREALAHFVSAREQESGDKPSFSMWLATLDHAALEPADRSRLIDDLASALQSLDAAKSSSFICE